MLLKSQCIVIHPENTNLRLVLWSYLKIWLFCCTPLFLISIDVFSQTDNLKAPSVFDMLEQAGEFEVLLNLPLDTILAQKLTANEHPGKIHFLKGDSLILELPVKLSVRGKFRRRTCFLPPIKLDFDKDDLVAKGLSKSDEYKLVTHCLDDEEATDFLKREYLAYKIYENLSEYSYRTLFFPITYVDTYSGERMKSFGFILESNDEFPDRFDGSWSDSKFVMPDTIDPYYLEFISLFHYMIGNEDVIYNAQHNIRLLHVPNMNLLIPVPYDFDFSVLVAAPYAFKDDGYGYRRKYMGFEENAEHMSSIIKRYLNAKDEIEAEIESCPILSKGEKNRCLKVIKDFYRELKKSGYQLKYHQ